MSFQIFLGGVQQRRTSKRNGHFNGHLRATSRVLVKRGTHIIEGYVGSGGRVRELGGLGIDVRCVERWHVIRIKLTFGCALVKLAQIRSPESMETFGWPLPYTIFASTAAERHKAANYEERETIAFDISNRRVGIT